MTLSRSSRKPRPAPNTRKAYTDFSYAYFHPPAQARNLRCSVSKDCLCSTPMSAVSPIATANSMRWCRHRRLLRSRRQRPRGRRAAEQRDELEPFQLIKLHSISHQHSARKRRETSWTGPVERDVLARIRRPLKLEAERIDGTDR